MPIQSARKWIRRATFAGMAIVAAVLLFLLARGGFAIAGMATQASAATQSRQAAGGPSPTLLLAAARMREAHIIAAETHPKSGPSPEVSPPPNAPNPIPATVFSPGPGLEASTITDFNGFTGIAAISGTGAETVSGVTSTGEFFDSDDRFMKGLYVGVDGQTRNGTFAFI
jgi:hypothetical protein